MSTSPMTIATHASLSTANSNDKHGITYTTRLSSSRQKSPPDHDICTTSSGDNITIASGDNLFLGDAESPPKQTPGGLSELSKQLRFLQAKNQFQGSTIDRLERQLKIMSDLKGVSVAELKGSLANACQSEAYAELLSQVSSLQDQLVHAKESSITPVSNQMEFEKEAANKTIAALELRVGELEEVEENLRIEMKRLYQKSENQTSKTTRLESTTEQQMSQIEGLKMLLDEASFREKDFLAREEATRNELEQVAQVASECQLQLQHEQDRAARLENELEVREAEKKKKLKGVRKAMNADMIQIQRLLSEQVEKSAHLRQLNQTQKAEIDALKAKTMETTRSVEEGQEVKATVLLAEIADLRTKVQDFENVIEFERQQRQIDIKTKEQAATSHLDEVETRLKDGTQTMFRLWDKESGKALRFEAACNQEKAMVAKLQQQLASYQENERLRQGESTAEHAEIELLQTKLREAEIQAQVDKEQAQNLSDQVNALENDAKLRKKQFNSRFKVQTDRIVDLEQQLSSLYSAIGIFQSERSEEQTTIETLQTDTAIAQQMNSELQVEELETVRERQQDMVNAEIASQLFFSESRKQKTEGSTTTMTSSPKKASSPAVVGIHAGWLLKKDRLKGWKKRFFVLRGNFEEGIFYLRYGDHPSAPAKGSIFVQSSSIVVPTKEYPKQPFALTIQSDPSNAKGDMTHLAAQNAEELQEWICALQLLKSSKRTSAFSVGSVVVIDGPHVSYNGLSGVIQSPMKENGCQKVWVDALERAIHVPLDHLKPENFEPQEQAAHHSQAFSDRRVSATTAAQRQQRILEQSCASATH